MLWPIAVTKISSFDVFDTALVRRTAYPSDVFYLVAKMIEQDLSSEAKKNFAEDFVAARVSAEKLALSGREEATLKDIWTILNRQFPFLSKVGGPDKELAIEDAVLAPNMSVWKEIRLARERGQRIIFISDTYLPGAFVKSQLLRHGVAFEGDGIYVSSDVGFTKRSGNLFREVLKREAITADAIHHYGDNLQSDYIIPRDLSMGATIIKKPELNKWELALLGRRAADKEFAIRLVGNMKLFRINSPVSNDAGITDLVGTFLGPLVVLWAAWVLNRARSDAISRLYFVARDGSLLWRAAKILAPHFKNIECRYLKISRSTVLLSTTENFSRESVPWLQRGWEPASLNRLVNKLGLDWSTDASEFRNLAGEQGSTKILVTPDEWQEFWRISESPSVSGRIESKMKTQRQNLLQYLRTERVTATGRSAMVDIGWSLNIQSGLHRLLGKKEGPNSLVGYYLGVSHDRVGRSAVGIATALFYKDSPDRSPNAVRGQEIFQRVEILEHMLGLADHGTILEHRNMGGVVEPIAAPVSTEHATFVSKVVNSIEDFSRSFDLACFDLVDDNTARELIDGIVASWCGSPSKMALDTLTGIEISDDPNNLDAHLLIEKWKLKEAGKKLIPTRLRYLLGVTVNEPAWPEAAFIQSTKLVKCVLCFRQAMRILLGKSSI